MIPDVDETLRRMMTAELGRVPGCPVYDAEQITFDSPTEAAASQDGEARVNLYLHDLRENLEHRDESFVRVRGGDADGATVGLRRAPVRMNLTYLVTVHAGHDAATEHRLMADVLGVLLTYLAVPNQYLIGSLEGLGSNSILMSVAQPDDLELFNPSSLWQALESQMQPSLVLVVTAPFNPFESKWTKRVREMVYGTARGTRRDGFIAPDNLTTVRLSATGIVLDQQTEKALVGAQVGVPGLAETTTDEDGIFALSNLPTGPHTLQFRHRGYRTGEAPVRVPTPGRTDQVQPVVMALRAMNDAERESAAAERQAQARNAPDVVGDGRAAQTPLTGTVRLPSGAPAAFVPVRIGSREALTDADGIFCFFDLPPGEHTPVATVPGQGEISLPAVKTS